MVDLFILKVCYSPTIWDWLNKLLFHVLQGSHHHFFFLLGLSSDCFDILFEALHFLLSKNKKKEYAVLEGIENFVSSDDHVY